MSSSSASSPSAAPSAALLGANQLVYEGAFLLPDGVNGASEPAYAEGPIALGSDGTTLFMVGHTYQQAVAEFTIPALTGGSNLSGLSTASYRQSFVQLLGRPAGGNPQKLDRISGMASIDGKLLVNAYLYYDAAASATQTTLVVKDAGRLASSAVAGYHAYPEATHAAGWISPIPAEWQTPLGGNMLTGFSSGIPIISRASVGPSAFVFDGQASALTGTAAITIPSTTLLDYSLEHVMGFTGSDSGPYLYNSDRSNKLWTHLSKAAYGFIVPGTSTYLVVGYTGGTQGGICYKDQVGCPSDCGGYCPLLSDDWRPYYWMFDMANLQAVKAGARASYSVVPYAYGELTLPGFAAGKLVTGGAYDHTSKRLYLNLGRGNGTLPAIVVMKVN